MHIEQLESKHLLQILNHLSLQECIALLPVCRRWKSLVESITGALDTLKIVVADIDTTENTQIDYQQQLDRFSLFHLNPAIDHHQTLTLSLSSSSISINTASLIHLIPSISHLIIYFGPVHYLHRRKKLHQMSSSTLCSLLEGWPQLRSLSLLGSISPLSTEEGVRLAGAINSLVRLRRLDSLLTSLCPLPLTRLTKTLSRLKHLSLFAYPGDISLALVRLGPSIRHLNLHQYFPMESNLILSELAPSLITCPHLTTSLTELRIKGLASAQIFPFITGHFRYLQLLDLAFDLAIKINFDVKLLMNLNWLRHLAELRLVNVYLDLAAFEKELPLVQSVMTIKSLHLINLVCCGKLDAPLAHHLLTTAFPNVDSINVHLSH